MMPLSTAASMMDGQLVGDDKHFTSVGTDSRHIEDGQLFYALKGEHFDGHAYLKSALEAGAAGVVVNQTHALDEDIKPAIVVEDTYKGLGLLAAGWRAEFSGPVVGITGSNGKTTVKEMLAAILKQKTGGQAKVLSTKGNLNNHIGLPLTLLNIKKEHAYAVVEMGMNHEGEIRYLTQIAKPDVVLINNAGSAHLGELGSLEAIARAKGEIIEGLAEAGTAVLNGDDHYYEFWKKLVNDKPVMTFGFNAGHDVQGLLDSDGQLEIRAQAGEVTVKLQSLGEHNAKNALAATAVALVLGASLSEIKSGLERFGGVAGRLQQQAGFKGALLIDDTYNANPMSMRAAVDVLKAFGSNTILVAGDMGELGEDAREMHAEIGAYAKQVGINHLFTFGTLSAAMTKAFGVSAQHFESLEALIETIKTIIDEHTTVLVKGSRYMKMERVVNALQPEAVNKEKH